MTALPVAPAETFGTKLLHTLEQVARKLLGYAIDQFRANPAVVISGAARIVSGAAGKLPAKLVAPARKLVAVSSAVAIKNVVSPAVPEQSPVQAAAARLKARLR